MDGSYIMLKSLILKNIARVSIKIFPYDTNIDAHTAEHCLQIDHCFPTFNQSYCVQTSQLLACQALMHDQPLHYGQ